MVRRGFAIGLALLFGASAFGQSRWVKPHNTKKGTSVSGHFRKPPAPKPKKIKPSKAPKSVKSSRSVKFRQSTPSKVTKASGGYTIPFPPDERFRHGDRLISIKDAAGKTTSIKTERDIRAFMDRHSPNEDVTLRIKRDGKYLSRKVKKFGSTFLF